MRALDHRLPARDVAKGGGRRGCVPPWGFRGPEGRWPARAKTQAEATETLTETLTQVMKSVRKPTKKHVRAVGAPLTIWSREKNRAPLTIRGPPNYQGPYEYEGERSCEHQGPSDNQGPF